MEYALIVAVTFIVTVFLHVVVHRAFVGIGIMTSKTIAVYVVGFVFLVIIAVEHKSSFALTSLFLYSLLVILYLLFFLSYYLEAESPSAKILMLLKHQGSMRYKDIINQFTEKELFEPRLLLLKRSEHIKKRGDRYYILPKGTLLTQIFSVYRRLLRWDRGG